MAELNVEPKKSNWWIWLVVALIAIALIYFLTRNNDNADSMTDSVDSIGWISPTATFAEGAC
jgi:hypothetical protein